MKFQTEFHQGRCDYSNCCSCLLNLKLQVSLSNGGKSPVRFPWGFGLLRPGLPLFLAAVRKATQSRTDVEAAKFASQVAEALTTPKGQEMVY